MRRLTDAEIQQINGSGSTTYNLPYGTTITTTQMPNQTTTITGQLSDGTTFSVNSGQQLAKFLIGAGAAAMTFPFLGPVGAFIAGQSASFGAGKLMGGVNTGG